MNAHVGIKAYAKVEVESGVSSADPHKLVSMLYQGALLAIANARNSIMRKDIPAKGAAISKAITIIDDGLFASLDKKVGGELAQNLASLYEYMVMRLLAANLNNDITILDEVSRLLGELQGAWEAIRPGAQTTKTPEIVSASRPDNVEKIKATAPQSSIGKQAALMYGRM